MIEIEQAIYLLRGGAENWRYTSQEWLDDKDAEAISLAIEALKEKAEREKGCDFCNAEYAVMSGSRMNSDLIHKGCAAKFCPNCGKRLVSEE